MKKVLIGITVVVVVIAGVIVYGLLNAGDIVKQVVEEVGSKSTQAKVTLTSVDLSLQEGSVALNGFVMGNPKGYSTPRAMSFGLVRVTLDTQSIASDPVVVKEVVITKPEFTYEILGSDSNFGAIQRNVDSYARSMGVGGGAPAEKTESGSGKKVVIENLYVRDGRVSVSAPFLAGKEMGVGLPTIHLKDIGKGKGGATPAEVADQLMTAISQTATRAVSTLDLDKMMGGAKKMLEGGAEGAKKLLEGGAGGGTKVLDDAGKGVGDALKGLLGK